MQSAGTSSVYSMQSTCDSESIEGKPATQDKQSCVCREVESTHAKCHSVTIRTICRAPMRQIDDADHNADVGTWRHRARLQLATSGRAGWRRYSSQPPGLIEQAATISGNGATEGWQNRLKID